MVDCSSVGPSSNIAFLGHLSRAVARYSNFPTELTSPHAGQSGSVEGGFLNASRPPSAAGQRRSKVSPQKDASIFTLPPRSETLELIQRYFSDTGLLFPYVYPQAFIETYDKMVQENFTKVRRTWLGLLNMILAMAKITAVPGCAQSDTRIADSDIFYQRGLSLCGNEIFRGTTLEVGELVSIRHYSSGDF